MRRAALVASAAILTVGLVAAPAQAKVKKVKVDTDIFIDGYDASGGPPDVTFFGHLTADKPKCLRKRTVHLEQTTKGIDAGSTKSEDDGDWEITFNGYAVPQGDFEARADRKVYKKKRHGEVVKKIICKAGVSETFSVGDM